MAFAVSLLLGVLCLGVVLYTVTAAASTPSDLPSALYVDICGDISAGTWTAAESPYRVTCDSVLLPGTILTIEPGVQIQFTAGVSLTVEGKLSAIGTPVQPIVFTSDQELPAPGDWSGLHFVAGSSGSQLSWCLVAYATSGVHVYAGPGETVGPALSDCTVRHNSMYGILIEGFTSACDVGLAQPTITGCLVEHNGQGDDGGCGIYGYGHGDPDNGCEPEAAGSVGGVVTGSMIRQNEGPGICLEARLDEKGHGDVWIAIEANDIRGNSGPGVHLHDLFGDDPVRPRIENNLVYTNTGAGLQSDAEHKEMELVVANNTVVANGGDGVAFNRSALLVHFVNNIVVENGGYGLVANASNDPQASNNNLWHNASGGYYDCLPGVDDISADPLFVDRAADDFHLTLGSPCIDAGTSEGAPVTDIEGIARPQGDRVDIGAHELWYQRICLPLALRE